MAAADEPAGRVRAVVERVVAEIDPEATVSVREDEETIEAVVEGEELALLIGRQGATLDALQYLASRAAFPGPGVRKNVVVDAEGYRERRAGVLQRTAEQAVADALRSGQPVELEPMSAQERKVVHTYLKDRAEVDTHSEGDEPERRLVITPVQDAG